MKREPETESKVSRRGFLGGAAAGAVGGGFAAIAGSAFAGAQVSAPTSAGRQMRADVVAVGGGIGGLTAALRAQQAGARVIVLEKASEPGGNTAPSNGQVMCHTYENMRANAPDGDPDVQRTVFENVGKWFEMMDALDAPLGALRARPGTNNELTVRIMAARIWVKCMVQAIERGGGKVLVETPMIRLLANGRNEIVGALADSPRGTIRIYAKSVVLATGGWMNNAQLMQRHVTRYFGSMRQFNVSASGKPPFLGDGLLAAMQLGAQTSTGGFDSFHGHLMPARPGNIPEPMINFTAQFAPWAVAVNRFGRRFTDEAQGRMTGRQMTNQGGEFCAQEVARQPDAMAAYVCDVAVYKRYACDDCDTDDSGDYMHYKMAGAPTAKAGTLPELARQMEAWGVGMSAEAILHDIAEYNQAAGNGKAWALPVPKTSAKHAIALEKPPFYAILGQAGIIATQGGIRVNTKGQVLHRNGKPIPGLFAAGVDIGNFNNCAYLGNLNLGAAYGYVSGENAAKQTAPQGGWEAASQPRDFEETFLEHRFG